ncbi:MAG: hypothetical protein ABR569_12550 [Gaiellaceae bacterium]
MALDEGWLEVRPALERLPGLTRRRRQAAAAAALVAVGGAAGFGTGRSAAGAALLVAATFGVAYARLVERERVAVLTRVVASGFADATPETERFGEELVSFARRRRLAEGLARAAAAGRPGLHEFVFVRPERAGAVGRRLEGLAERFRDPAELVSPRSAALCRRLLLEPPASPLYNDTLPAAQLERALDLMEAGFDRGSARHS